MTLPNRIGYSVQRQEPQPVEQTTQKSPTPKPKKKKKQEVIVQKEDVQIIKKKFDDLIDQTLVKVKDVSDFFEIDLIVTRNVSSSKRRTYRIYFQEKKSN